MKTIFLFNKENLFIVFLLLFSLLINQYYGNRGVFPLDSFSHFDAGFRILLGEYPFKDYWAVSGPFIDYLQAVFFYLFGINWQSYVLHASLVNVALTITTYIVLRNFKLNIYYSFIYSLLFSVLAYPPSGTPFMDHHSAFFSLLGIYNLILAIKSEKKLYWILLPIFFGFAFLSKQVPSSYVIICAILILSLFSILQRKFYWVKYSFFSATLFILLLLIFGKIQGINLSSFLEQYIFYPQTIGKERFENLNFTFRGTIDHFKFIYLAFLPLFYVNLIKIFSDRNYFKQKNFYYFLCLLLLTFSLIFHQLLTKNQTFIFFLIPILTAFSHISLNVYRLNSTSPVYVAIIIICLFITAKYHLRFNEDRKFHELSYVNFELASQGKKIDKKLTGLKWITPEFKNNPNEEIILINEAKTYLSNDHRNKMVMTHYSFFSAILDQKLFSPSKWYLSDGTTHPVKESKYFTDYKNLITNIIRENNIKVIYTISVESWNIYNYVNSSCFQEKKITEILISYELKDCESLMVRTL